VVPLLLPGQPERPGDDGAECDPKTVQRGVADDRLPPSDRTQGIGSLRANHGRVAEPLHLGVELRSGQGTEHLRKRPSDLGGVEQPIQISHDHLPPRCDPVLAPVCDDPAPLFESVQVPD